MIYRCCALQVITHCIYRESTFDGLLTLIVDMYNVYYTNSWGVSWYVETCLANQKSRWPFWIEGNRPQGTDTWYFLGVTIIYYTNSHLYISSIKDHVSVPCGINAEVKLLYMTSLVRKLTLQRESFFRPTIRYILEWVCQRRQLLLVTC